MALGLTRYETATGTAWRGGFVSSAHVVTVTLVEADGFASAECDECGWYISGDPDGATVSELRDQAVRCHSIGVDSERMTTADEHDQADADLARRTY